MASAAASTSNTLPMVVTRTARCTTVRGLTSRMQHEQEGGVVSWRVLPSDLYGQILRRLPSRGDRVRLGAVCHHWRVCAWQQLPRVCQALPMRVSKMARGTHVVHVRGFSMLQEQQCGGVGGFVDSPAFAVGGFHWAIRYYPGSDDADGDDERGHVGAFVVLLTEGMVARAYVGLRLLDQTTGLADTTIIWDHSRTRFKAEGAKSWDQRRRHTRFNNAESAESCNARGTGKVATRSELKGSRFVRGDCLKIECVLDDVSRDYRVFKRVQYLD